MQGKKTTKKPTKPQTNYKLHTIKTKQLQTTKKQLKTTTYFQQNIFPQILQ
jgi:hypothetical protein